MKKKNEKKRKAKIHKHIKRWSITCRATLALSEYQLTKASSGSELGSNAYSEAYSIPGEAPSSPCMIGDEMRASDRSGPGGTVTR